MEIPNKEIDVKLKISNEVIDYMIIHYLEEELNINWITGFNTDDAEINHDDGGGVTVHLERRMQ